MSFINTIIDDVKSAVTALEQLPAEIIAKLEEVFEAKKAELATTYINFTAANGDNHLVHPAAAQPVDLTPQLDGSLGAVSINGAPAIVTDKPAEIPATWPTSTVVPVVVFSFENSTEFLKAQSDDHVQKADGTSVFAKDVQVGDTLLVNGQSLVVKSIDPVHQQDVSAELKPEAEQPAQEADADRTQVHIKLDENDPNPQGTVEQVAAEAQATTTQDAGDNGDEKEETIAKLVLNLGGDKSLTVAPSDIVTKTVGGDVPASEVVVGDILLVDGVSHQVSEIHLFTADQLNADGVPVDDAAKQPDPAAGDPNQQQQQ